MKTYARWQPLSAFASVCRGPRPLISANLRPPKPTATSWRVSFAESPPMDVGQRLLGSSTELTHPELYPNANGGGMIYPRLLSLV